MLFLRRATHLFTMAIVLGTLMACGGETVQSESPIVVNKSPNDERDYAAVTLDNGLKVLPSAFARSSWPAAASGPGPPQ